MKFSELEGDDYFVKVGMPDSVRYYIKDSFCTAYSIHKYHASHSTIQRDAEVIKVDVIQAIGSGQAWDFYCGGNKIPLNREVAISELKPGDFFKASPDGPILLYVWESLDVVLGSNSINQTLEYFNLDKVVTQIFGNPS